MVRCLGEWIQTRESFASGAEGDSMTLSCSYNASDTRVYLYWFRRYPNQALQ
ncbi:unnamed protein product [Natator depressus]